MAVPLSRGRFVIFMSVAYSVRKATIKGIGATQNRRQGRKVETEQMIRSMAKMDGEVNPNDLERAINIMRGVKDDNQDLVHVIRRKDAARMLGVHRRTLDYYIQRGYLKRVYGGGERAIGVSRDSYLKFIARRSGR